eukprot:4081300-Pyramimonas_sp.AAC.1
MVPTSRPETKVCVLRSFWAKDAGSWDGNPAPRYPSTGDNKNQAWGGMMKLAPATRMYGCTMYGCT